MRLIAKRPVLYLARQYKAGEELPTSDPVMVEAWIAAGTACVSNPGEAPKEASRAELVTAMPGISGVSSTGESDPIVGRIPDSAEREKPKPRRRRSTVKVE